MPVPTTDEVLEYLGDDVDQETLDSAYAAEKSHQAQLCAVPADNADWPAALAEALCRRVAVNLVLRGLPLAYQPQMTDMAVTAVRVGGRDPEVDRLEGPWRNLVAS